MLPEDKKLQSELIELADQVDDDGKNRLVRLFKDLIW
jgi:hypothetical protein